MCTTTQSGHAYTTQTASRNGAGRATPLATRQLVIETTASGHRAGVLGAAILGANGALSPERMSHWIHSGISA
jgi:hypothetical protein